MGKVAQVTTNQQGYHRAWDGWEKCEEERRGGRAHLEKVDILGSDAGLGQDLWDSVSRSDWKEGKQCDVSAQMLARRSKWHGGNERGLTSHNLWEEPEKGKQSARKDRHCQLHQERQIAWLSGMPAVLTLGGTPTEVTLTTLPMMGRPSLLATLLLARTTAEAPSVS